MAKKIGARNELTAAKLSLFFANLELIYHSGLTPAEGFNILKKGAEEAEDREWLDGLYKCSVGGLSLTDSLKKLGGVPTYALSLLAIGEKTGRLEDTFRSLSSYYTKRDELSQTLRSALAYPLTMLLMVLVVVIVLLTQAMPVFDQVYDQLGLSLDGIAALLLSVGQALRASALWITIGLAAVIVLGLILRLTPAGKKFFSFLYERAPVTGDLSFKVSVQQFALAMSTMLRSGLAHDESLALVEPLLEDSEATYRVQEMRKKIGKGASLQTAVEESELFAAEEMSLLAVGFRTGTDAQAFDQVGVSIARTTERKLGKLIGILEPVLVACMCVLVGVVLLSVMLPLLGVLSNI